MKVVDLGSTNEARERNASSRAARRDTSYDWIFLGRPLGP